MALVTLPPALAERAGCTEVDVREVDDIWGIYRGTERLRCFTIAEEAAIIDQVLPHERAPEPGPGRPLRRGEKSAPRHRGERVSARRTGRYTAMMHRGAR